MRPHLPPPGQANFNLEIDSVEMIVDVAEIESDDGIYSVEITDSAAKSTVTALWEVILATNVPVAETAGLVALCGVLCAAASGLLRRRKF
ncbi:MAG: hypothetical protein HYV27_03195 [Candidatus Hydrogenedentes bacterium]|nr:hypothetical protein [Candidatus Hydrogenedentota bacterium]